MEEIRNYLKEYQWKKQSIIYNKYIDVQKTVRYNKNTENHS